MRQIASADDYHVQSAQQFLVAAKTLANETLYAIALHRLADLLAGDRQTEPRPLPVTAPGQHGERFVAGFLRALEYACVVASGQQAHVPLQSQTRRLVEQVVQTGTLGGETGSTFGASGFDDFSAGVRRHAGAKAVPPLAFQSARLKWSFHCAAPVARIRKSNSVHDSQKGLNANVTFHGLSNARATVPVMDQIRQPLYTPILC